MEQRSTASKVLLSNPWARLSSDQLHKEGRPDHVVISISTRSTSIFPAVPVTLSTAQNDLRTHLLNALTA